MYVGDYWLHVYREVLGTEGFYIDVWSYLKDRGVPFYMVNCNVGFNVLYWKQTRRWCAVVIKTMYFLRLHIIVSTQKCS